MSIVLADRVMETTTTTGTGTVSLAGAKTGYRGFVAGAGAAAVVYYTIAGQAGGAAEGEWEVGMGTVTDAAPDTLSRTTILSSSNAGAAVDFSAGTKDVFLTLPAKAPVVNIGTFSPSAAASVDIIITGYDSVRIVGWVRPATDNAVPWLLVSNDGGSTFRAGASDYVWAYRYLLLESGGSNVVYDAADSQIDLGGGVGNGASEQIDLDILVTSPTQSDTFTMIKGDNIEININGQWVSRIVKASVKTKEVNNAVRILFSTGNIASGHLVAYGFPAP